MSERRYSLRPRPAFASQLPSLTTGTAGPLDLTFSPLTPLDPSPATPSHLTSSTPAPHHASDPTAHPPTSVPPFFTLDARPNPGIWGPRMIFYPHLTGEPYHVPALSDHDTLPTVETFWTDHLTESDRSNVPSQAFVLGGTFDAFLALLREIALPGDLHNGRLSVPTQTAVLATLGLGGSRARQFDREVGIFYQAHREELDAEADATYLRREAETREEAGMRGEIDDGRDGMDWGSEDGEHEVVDDDDPGVHS